MKEEGAGCHSKGDNKRARRKRPTLATSGSTRGAEDELDGVSARIGSPDHAGDSGL